MSVDNHLSSSMGFRNTIENFVDRNPQYAELLRNAGLLGDHTSPTSQSLTPRDAAGGDAGEGTPTDAEVPTPKVKLPEPRTKPGGADTPAGSVTGTPAGDPDGTGTSAVAGRTPLLSPPKYLADMVHQMTSENSHHGVFASKLELSGLEALTPYDLDGNGDPYTVDNFGTIRKAVKYIADSASESRSLDEIGSLPGKMDVEATLRKDALGRSVEELRATYSSPELAMLVAGSSVEMKPQSGEDDSSETESATGAAPRLYNPETRGLVTGQDGTTDTTRPKPDTAEGDPTEENREPVFFNQFLDQFKKHADSDSPDGKRINIFELRDMENALNVDISGDGKIGKRAHDAKEYEAAIDVINSALGLLDAAVALRSDKPDLTNKELYEELKSIASADEKYTELDKKIVQSLVNHREAFSMLELSGSTDEESEASEASPAAQAASTSGTPDAGSKSAPLGEPTAMLGQVLSDGALLENPEVSDMLISGLKEAMEDSSDEGEVITDSEVTNIVINIMVDVLVGSESDEADPDDSAVTLTNETTTGLSVTET